MVAEYCEQHESSWERSLTKMPKLNENYQNVKDSYLFAEIARRVKVYEETHPEKAADIIRLGIGDVTLPLRA